MLSRLLIILFTAFLFSCDEGFTKDMKLDVVDPESIVAIPPKDIKRNENDFLIKVNDIDQWQRYNGGTLVMVSNFQDSLAYKGVENFLNDVKLIYGDTQPKLNTQFEKIEGDGGILEHWYYINNDSFSEQGTIIRCSEYFGKTKKDRLDDSSCFVRGKSGRYYFNYTIYHDEYLKYGEEIHDAVIKEIKKLGQ